MIIGILFCVLIVLLAVGWYVTRLFKILCFTLEDYLADLFNCAWKNPDGLKDFYSSQLWRGREVKRIFPVFHIDDLDDL